MTISDYKEAAKKLDLLANEIRKFHRQHSMEYNFHCVINYDAPKLFYDLLLLGFASTNSNDKLYFYE